MTATLEARTYLPGDSATLTALHDKLDHGDDQEFALVGPSGRVVIPPEVHDLLVQVVEAMRQGKAVTVTPNERVLTTQEAADLLGVSRPTVVKLVETGELPAQRISQRRKINLSDVLAYRERRRQAQLEAIAATSAGIEESDVELDLERAKSARREVAQRRRQRIEAQQARVDQR